MLIILFHEKGLSYTHPQYTFNGNFCYLEFKMDNKFHEKKKVSTWNSRSKWHTKFQWVNAK